MAHKKEATIEVFAYLGSKVPEQYINLVRSHWVRSYKKANDFMNLVHRPAYYSAYNTYTKAVLKRPGVIVRVAVLSDDKDVALGFSIMEGSTLHYVHVPRLYRRQGIATLLLPEYLEWITHVTKIWMHIWPKKFPRAKFDPFR